VGRVPSWYQEANIYPVQESNIINNYLKNDVYFIGTRNPAILNPSLRVLFPVSITIRDISNFYEDFPPESNLEKPLGLARTARANLLEMNFIQAGPSRGS